MEQEREEAVELAKGDMNIQASGGDYVIVPEGEDIKAHIGKVSKVYTDNFDKTGKEWKLVIPFVLDEGEGKGQVYSSWIAAKLHPKSTLGLLLKAVDGTIPFELDPVSLEGKPLRVRMVDYTTSDGQAKQRVDKKVFTKPAADQKVVELEAKDVVVEADTDLEAVEAVFGPDVKKVG